MANWSGICLSGARTEADGPKPLTTEGPLPMHFEYGDRVPSGFVLLEHPDFRFLVPGLFLFAGSYAISQFYFLFQNWTPSSLVPFAGPLLQFFMTEGTLTTGTERQFLVALGFSAAQVLGAAGIVVGIVKPIRWLERSTVTVVPSPGGVALLGTF